MFKSLVTTLKTLFYWFTFVALVMVMARFAQAQTNVMLPMPETDYLNYILQAIQDGKMLKGTALTILLVQVVMNTLRTDRVVQLLGGKLKASVQWTLVALLSLIGAILTLKGEGLTWAAIVAHSQVIAAFQVFYHQAYKVYTEKKV